VNKKSTIIMAVLIGSLLAVPPYRLKAVSASSTPQNETAPKAAAETGKDVSPSTPQPINATRAAREEKALQDARRQQLAEREAALAAKEQELKKLSSKLEAQVKALEENKKRLDESLKAKSDAQKKKQDEKIQKMVKLFKSMKAEQAGKMIDSLKEDLALSLLSRLDTKTVAKLAPFINQPRVIKWVSDNLQER
jgi:flagellar motility protein MotE (MotC chaperone)